MFRKLVELGDKLINIHLMHDKTRLEQSSRLFPFVDGGNRKVEKKSAGSAYKSGRVYINKVSYFDDVPEEQWRQYIGGYMPLQKWLKDRKGNALSEQDIQHYSEMIAALKLTKEIMAEIEAVVQF